MREARRDVSKCALEKHRVEDLAEREREERERSEREAVLLREPGISTGAHTVVVRNESPRRARRLT